MYNEKANEIPDGDAGDVIITVVETPHEVFKRKVGATSERLFHPDTRDPRAATFLFLPPLPFDFAHFAQCFFLSKEAKKDRF